MVFSSTVFLFVFLPILLVLYYLPFKNDFAHCWKNAILLIFSILFYAWGEPVFVFIMLASILINWYLVLIMDRTAEYKKIWMVIAILFDVLVLGIFKYLSFVSENIALLTGNNRLVVDIALPIGISFFSFQMMSYVLDVYYGNAKGQNNPFNLALYLTLFPQLIAGPIVRYKDIESEIIGRKETIDEFSMGVKRFIYGLAKKVLLANFLAQVADNIFYYLSRPSVVTAWLGAIAYTLQIYYDFSGYSDMAIGIGKMLGFHFCENFNYPYIAKSVTDFWRRWHISLSSWFRDYIYIPLGGNKVEKKRWVMNLFIVWLLTGVWHGANWTFIMWGLIYFVILLTEKLTGFTKRIGVLSRIYTLIVVIIAWVVFKSADIEAAIRYIGCMLGFGDNGFVDDSFMLYLKGSYVVFMLAIIGVTPLISEYFVIIKKRGHAWVESIWVMVLFFVSLLEIINETYNPFIYFNF